MLYYIDSRRIGEGMEDDDASFLSRLLQYVNSVFGALRILLLNICERA